MTTIQRDLLDSLIKQTENISKTVEEFKKCALSELNYKSSPKSWSALECLEHLNLYYAFYLPEIRKRLDTSTYQPTETFKSGYLGNKFVKSMLPDSQGKIKKMNTFKSKNPINGNLDMSAIDGFLRKQDKLLDLLERSYSTDLNRVRTNITIARGLLKLKLGDTLSFIIYHNQRHINQALRMLKEGRVGDNQ